MQKGVNGGIGLHGASLLREIPAGLIPHLDTPPSSGRHHPGSAIALISSGSTLATDIRYALAHWSGLSRFLEDGRLEMDTNPVENTIRPVASEQLYVVAPRNHPLVRKHSVQPPTSPVPNSSWAA
jgi:DNA-binding transcriptional LysR family regulator